MPQSMSISPFPNNSSAYTFQMSEEIENAALNVPRAILTTMILNGATGFAMVIAVLFCLGDPEKVLVRLQAIIYLGEFQPRNSCRNHLPVFLSSKSSMTG